ncbi:hypothetical protein [Streptomyces sp. NPDC006307]|uniref:hypothetical protein n=1 Tax=Streptomyces sp. NPDC006307 TaxID=3156748 RepID=UPI0033B82C9A
MRVRISALAVSALVAGGLLIGGAHVEQPAVDLVAKTVTCNISQMQKQIADLRQKAQRLEHDGAKAEARKARAQATAIERKMRACIDSDNNASKPFPR